MLTSLLLPLFVAAPVLGPRQAPVISIIPAPATTVVAPHVLRADRPDTIGRDSLHASGPPLFTRSDLWLAGAFVTGTAVLLPLDGGITEEFRDPGPQRSTFLQHMASGFNTVGSPGVLLGSVGVYAIGRVGGLDRWARLGLYSTEAIAVSGAVTAVLKGVVGRARPYVNDTDPDRVVLDNGFRHGGGTSFPSGHATAAFAAATVVAGEAKRWWPDAAAYITPAAYGSAALVALARVYSNKHWASDVVMGAGIGTLSGLAIIHFNEAHPHNVINRVLLGASLLPDGRGGVAVGWTIPTR